MGYFPEYVILDVPDLLRKLKEQIIAFNKKTDSYLLIYASAIGKPIPDIPMSRDDYYTFFDILKDTDSKRISIFLETPGGSGDAAEEIANFLHKKFEHVSFIISGEAKSAGTILALSGHEILMTNTGSLGPIDAQVRIGRSTVSAFDYIKWVKDKKIEAKDKGELNPFDATMIAQISPGELCSVNYALKFAEDLVIEWLPKYKFAQWTVTRTKGETVTDELKKERAKEIARILTNHADWRTHGRSIKSDDLEKTVKLEIIKIDDNKELSEIVYRIHTIIRMIFSKSTIYKIFGTDKEIFRKVAMPKEDIRMNIPGTIIKSLEVATVEVKCPHCNENYKVYAKFVNNPKIDKDFKAKGMIPYPKNNILKCKCGFEINMSAMKNEIETKTGKKIIT